MNDIPDSATATQLHDALTDLADAMPASVALLDHVHDQIRRHQRRRRVARSSGAVLVAAAAVGGLVVLRAPSHQVTVAPASVPSPPALPSCAAVLASLPSTTVPAKAPPSVDPDAKAAGAAATGPGTPTAVDKAKAARAAADAAANDATATTMGGAAKEPPVGKAVESPPSGPGDHTKGLGTVAGTPTATSVSIAVTDGPDAGKTLTFTRDAATQYLAGDTPCAPEPLAAGQKIGYAATYNADGSLTLDYLLIQ
jgi:hypothetical protein